MTDQEIIQGLISRNDRVTRRFFFENCRPLFCTIISEVFSYGVDYDEFVNELYLYLMEDDAARLRQFGFRSSVYQWLKVTATRYFIRKRALLIENTSKEALYSTDAPGEDDAALDARLDLLRLLGQMGNKRYALVIERLVIDGTPPDDLAMEMKITTANLYNIKKRAIRALTLVAIKDINHYGKKRH